MADIRPFSAIRPSRELASRIAALPYDVYNREEALKEVEREPLSFLRIDRAETNFPSDVDTYDNRVYDKARELLWKMVEEGRFVQDEGRFYYIYELIMNGRSQTGIVACSSVDDYMRGIIKKHENTRADKEVDRINHVDRTGAQTGPIFLAYKSNDTINSIVSGRMKDEPLYDFTSDDGITHRVWIIEDQEECKSIKQAFAGMSNIYIADGHHRCASAVKVSLKRREAMADYTGDEEFNFFLSVLFPDDQLMIMDYNRVVRDLNGHSDEEFLKLMQEKYKLLETSDEQIRPDKKGRVSVYLSGKWYLFEADASICSTDPVKGLDVSVLQDQILGPILGIGDPKTDKRIDFVGGIRGLEELKRRADSDCRIAFAMYPTQIEELFEVADAGKLMPPKSTWFEPKLRSGLFIHKI